MSVMKRVARSGLATVTLGFSLVGPPAAGIAAAESPAGESSEASRPQSSQRGPSGQARASRKAANGGSAAGLGRGGRPGSVRPGPAAAGGSAVVPVAIAESESESGSGSAMRVPGRRAPGGGSVLPAVPIGQPTASAPAIGDDGGSNATTLIPGSSAGGAAAPATPGAAASLSDFGVPARPGVQSARRAYAQDAVAARPVATIGAAVNALFDSAANWLSGLPASPIAELLEGALLLVRRSLVNIFPALGAGQSAVETGETVTGAYLTEEELNAYLLDLAAQQYAGLFGQTVPVYGYGYGPWPLYLKAEMDAGGVASGTNTQVDGVDEADFVENDGQYMYVAHNGRLTIVRTDDLTVASESAIAGDVVGSFLSGDRLTVITQTGSGWYGPMVRMAYGYWGPWNPQTTVSVYDVSDRGAPAMVSETVFDGAYQDSRAVDGVVYLVLQRSLDLPAPQYTDTPVGKDPTAVVGDTPDALLKMPWGGSDITAYRTYESWDSYLDRVGPQIADLALAHAYSVDADGAMVDLGLIAGAGDIVRPQAQDQQALMTVVSLDSGANGGGFADGVGNLVSSYGGTVYMTTDAVYVASGADRYTDSSWTTETRIDRFAVTGTDIDWQAVGVVSGTLINQFAMDERDGYLRVATHTNSSQWGEGISSTRNDNGVYIFDIEGDTLDEVGRLTGLAPGEQLYAVRFMGHTAYLVTFLQTDPLFAIDLSDPAAPALQGELIIPGFSNYLQSVGDGLLLGIGQEREAGSSNTHLHASLFDVSDGASLNQIDREFLDSGYQWSFSEAQFDHHALLYSPQDGILVVPVSGSGYDPQTGYRSENFLAVVRITPEGIDVIGEIHTDEPTVRTVRIGDVLYAVGNTSVTAYRLDDLAEIGRTDPLPAVV